MWEAMFASPSLHQYRVYSYAIVYSPPDIFKGVTAGLRMPWNGVTRDAMPVELTSFNSIRMSHTRPRQRMGQLG